MINSQYSKLLIKNFLDNIQSSQNEVDVFVHCYSEIYNKYNGSWNEHTRQVQHLTHDDILSKLNGVNI